jgi:hypothetical protein
MVEDVPPISSAGSRSREVVWKNLTIIAVSCTTPEQTDNRRGVDAIEQLLRYQRASNLRMSWMGADTYGPKDSNGRYILYSGKGLDR